MTKAKSNEIRDKIEELIGQHQALYQLLHYFEGELSQESKRAVDEALIDKDFIVYCLNQAWNYAHEQLQKKDLGDIEREIYQQQKDKAKALMTKLDS